jgi:hypothetical protein
MKNKLLAFIMALLFLATNVNGQQDDGGAPYHFKRAWAYKWVNNAWAVQGRITPKYDNKGKGLGAIVEIPVSGKWIKVVINTVIYNTNRQAVSQVDSQYNGTAFLPNKLDSMWYNLDGTLLTKIVYKQASGTWVPFNKFNYKYANGNKLISEDFQQQWLSASKTWGNDDDYFYTYNSNKQIIQILDKNWQANTYVVDHRDTINFNTQGGVNEVVHQDTGAIKGTWVNSSKTTFDTATNSAIQEVILPQVNAIIFPNPSAGNAVLHLDNNGRERNMKLILTTISGATVKEIQISGSETIIEKGNLAPGLYMYCIQSAEGTLANGKLILR